MRGRASTTAAWVAGWRGAGGLLGAARLVDDPYGARFGGAWARALARAARREGVRRRLIAAAPVAHWAGYMQVRTRAIDDEVVDFVRGGGAQVVILGAGYDCRAARLDLGGARVWEIDHPATQARKRAVLGAAAGAAAYVAWDFERRRLEELPAVLARLGLDPARATLTIWEGVTMYLTEAAIDATFAAARRWGGAGSRLVFTYIERAVIERPRALAALLRAIGEPFRFGWDPAALPAWLDARGWALARDRRDVDLATQLLPAPLAAQVRADGRHVAVGMPR